MTVVPGDPTDVDSLAAALRADSGDLDIYARVVTNSLTEALPEGMVTIQRDRSLSDRMAGRPGTVTSMQIDVGDYEMQLIRGRHGVPEARIAQRVRGVVISSKPVGLDQWVTVLAQQLASLAQQSAAAREALGKLIGG